MKRPALFLLIIATSLSAQNRAPAPSPVTQLLQSLREAANPDQAARDVRTIWETDRWFTFPKFEETAKNVAAIMRRAGLEDVEIGAPPADGVTQGGFWTMPLAWDVKWACSKSSTRMFPPIAACSPITRKSPRRSGCGAAPRLRAEWTPKS